MKNQSFKSADDLIQGIKTILSDYRYSFSDEERVLLNDCIIILEQLKSESDLSSRMQATVIVVGMLIRIFSIINHFKDLF